MNIVAYRHSSLGELDNMKHMFPPYHPSDDRYNSFSSADNCAPYAVNFSMLGTSPAATNGQRRPSFDSMESVPLELLSASSVGTTSPSTPLNGSLFDSTCMNSFRNTAPHANLQAILGLQQDDFAEHDFCFSPVAAKDQSCQRFFTSYSTVYNTSDILNTPVSFYPTSYQVMSNEALSRPIFSGIVPSSTQMTMDNNTQWPPVTVAETPPRTIDPSTFAPLMLSSLPVKGEPSTPSRLYPRSSLILSSSPMSGYSPGIVPSQHEVDDSAYFGTSSLLQDSAEPILERMERERRLQSRLARRRYNHKGTGPSSKRRPLANKSGFKCEPVIPQNSFACSYADCIDKNTGKQKRFKRQEHKKRHEKTVHEKDNHSSHRCWVATCERAFSRTDNLKSHLKNTHGKRSANARNRYVATLDPNNEYYSPDWVGELTAEGLPIEK
jgi:hypothetical protein